MPTITLKLELLKPTQEKQKLYKQMTDLNTQFANWLLGLPSLSKMGSGVFKSFSTEKFPSAVVNQTIRDTKSQQKEQGAKLFKRMWCTFNNQNLKFEQEHSLYKVSFPTVEKRIGVPIVVKSYQQKWLDKIFTGAAKIGSGKLVRKKNKWYVYTSINFESELFLGKKTMGVDLGLSFLAVTSIGTQTQFFKGKELAFVRRKFAEYRRSLGKAKKLDAIRKSKGRESRWMRDLNHKISRSIVNEAKRNGVSVIRLEDLSGIRKANKHKRPHLTLHSWAFYQLREFITYKAAMEGIQVELVNPKYTSQTCKCGHRAKNNRNGLRFVCKKCGYTGHADANASINIAKAISGLSKPKKAKKKSS